MNAETALPRRANVAARLLAAVAAATLGMFVAAPSALAVPNNDNVQVPFNVDLNGGPVTINGGTIGATYEVNEPLTPGGTGACSGRTMISTTWYRVIGNGGTVSVNTTGSNFDTVISIYDARTLALDDGLPCNDDNAGALTSAVSFASTAGRAYLIQAGGCFGNGCGPDQGNIVLNVTATDPPPAGTPPPVVVPAPPPPDADGDAIPENGQDRCPAVKPTRDIDKDGCQDKPQRILADLTYNYSPYRRSGVIGGLALKKVQLTRVPRSATVRVSCARCLKADARGRTRRFRAYAFTAKRSGVQAMGRLNRVLIPRGATLKVVVTSAERLGRRITVRAGRLEPIETPSCLATGSAVARIPCSAGS